MTIGTIEIKGNCFKALSAELHSLIEDYQYCVEDIICEGNLSEGKIVVAEKHRGIWSKAIPEIPTSTDIVGTFIIKESNFLILMDSYLGKEFEHYMCSIYKVKNGIVVEQWSYDGANTTPAFAQAAEYLLSKLGGMDQQ
jgi:hypothetical protein